jgi:hypothetical protein
MKKKDPISEHAHELAQMQRFEGLRNALAIVRCFAEPSCPPSIFEGFEKSEKYLLGIYKPKVLYKDRLKNILKEANKMIRIGTLKKGSKFRLRGHADMTCK